MNKEFIPYEQALELKELGFNDGCLAGYSLDRYDAVFFDIKEQNGIGWLTRSNKGLKDHKGYCTTALYQQAFRWFREKYELNHIIIFQSKTKTYDAGIIGDIENFVDYNLIFNTYEEAELACLKKLIEIAKNK